MAKVIIAVLANHRHPRLRYVLREMERRLPAKFQLFTDTDKYLAAPAKGRINYGASAKTSDEIRLFAHSFMQGKQPTSRDLACVLVDKVASTSQAPLAGGTSSKPLTPQTLTKLFFLNDAQTDFDPFAIIFYCLSRYEEYQPFTPDRHQRFPATESHALRNDYLNTPIVDHLIAELGFRLGLLNEPQTTYLHLTYDVDLPYAYRLRGWRGLAACIRDLLTGHPRRVRDRFRITDPFDTFHWLREISLGRDRHVPTDPARPRVFFLLAEQRSSLNPNPSPHHPIYRRIIHEVAEWADIGIHPSYYASDQPELMERELGLLREVGDTKMEPIRASRQHYLRFRFPDTFRDLIRAGITDDYSIGYADQIGWRAGTNFPFYFYDLEHEKQTHLTLHPFAVMDVTLLHYMGLAPCEVSATVHQLREKCSPLGGPFTLLWHNSSFAEAYGWAGWRDIYLEIIGGQIDTSMVSQTEE